MSEPPRPCRAPSRRTSIHRRMPSPRPSSKISVVQQGIIAQNEFAKLLMIRSGGRIELAAPLTDDERRDFEIHVRGQYGWALAMQVKSALEVGTLGGTA